MTHRSPTHAFKDRVVAAPARKAFTLVEILVSIGVIAVLISIAVPALRMTRDSAEQVVCLTKLGQIGVMQASYASDHQGRWPAVDRPPGPESPRLNIDDWMAKKWNITAIDLIELWSNPLRDYLPKDSELTALETFTCPVVLKFALFKLSQPDDHPEYTKSCRICATGVWAARSYLYSPALFTEISAWQDAEAVPDINLVYKDNVRMSDVRFPSKKTAIVEAASRHGGDFAWLQSASGQFFNVLAADAHAERRIARQSNLIQTFTGFSLNHFINFRWTDTPVPLLGTRGGALGHDW